MAYPHGSARSLDRGGLVHTQKQRKFLTIPVPDLHGDTPDTAYTPELSRHCIREPKPPKPPIIRNHPAVMARMGFSPIQYPQRQAEFEVQAMLFAQLRQCGFDVRGEVFAYQSRFDLVVFDVYQCARVLIEVKPCHGPLSPRQRQAYERYGLPFLCCYGVADIATTLERVSTIMTSLNHENNP